MTRIMQSLRSTWKDVSYSFADCETCRTTACYHLTISVYYNKLQFVWLTKDNRDSKNLWVAPDSRTVKPINLDGFWTASRSSRSHSHNVVPASAESLLFSDTLMAWQMPPSNSVLPSLNSSGHGSHTLLVIYIYM